MNKDWPNIVQDPDAVNEDWCHIVQDWMWLLKIGTKLYKIVPRSQIFCRNYLLKFG